MIQGPSPKGAGALFDTTTIYGEHTDQVFRYETFKIFRNGIPRTGIAFLGGCSDDRRHATTATKITDTSVKLHKEASYDALSRAQKPQLDYLSEASKVQVSLYYDGTTITQSLTLSAPDKQSAEFGLRSEKLRLLTGQYQIITFSLFNADDELIYNGMPGEERLDIVAGGLVFART